MPLTLPQTIDPGTSVSAAEVQANFDAIKTYVDTLGTGGSDTSFRQIAEAPMRVAGNTSFTAATYIWRDIGLGGTGSSLSTADGLLGRSYFDDADFTLSGETPVLRLRAECLTNATAPGITFTFGLHEITASAGGAGVLVPTVNTTAVTGSTVAITTPSLSTRNSAVTSTFAVPSDGHYALGVLFSGTLATNAAVGLGARLQVRVAD